MNSMMATRSLWLRFSSTDKSDRGWTRIDADKETIGNPQSPLFLSAVIGVHPRFLLASRLRTRVCFLRVLRDSVVNPFLRCGYHVPRLPSGKPR
jgi:hypothetical protein